MHTHNPPTPTPIQSEGMGMQCYLFDSIFNGLGVFFLLEGANSAGGHVLLTGAAGQSDRAQSGGSDKDKDM